MNRCFAVGLLARACRRVAWAEVEPKAATEAAYVRRAVLAEVCACAATSLALPAARSSRSCPPPLTIVCAVDDCLFPILEKAIAYEAVHSFVVARYIRSSYHPHPHTRD